MTLPYLPDDCIYYILKYIQNYRSTLFNCLLVNRFWCEATVPLLYADPFKDFDYGNHASIILTLILCFNEAELLQLKNQLKLIEIKNKNSIDISNEYKPLFEYPKYLKNFDYPTMAAMMFQWFKIPYYPYYHNYDTFILMFYQLILHQCNNIERLNIQSINNYHNYIVQIFPSNLTCLTSLRLCLNMEDNNENLKEFLNNVDNNCLNLRKLEVFPTTRTSPTNTIIKEKFCTIIQKQNNLKAIKFSSHCQSLSNGIFLSLEFQKHSLAYAEFTGINFSNISFKILISLYNLKYLRFNRCEGVSLNQCEMFNFASFKLKALMFHDNNWNENITSLIIKYLGASLRELILVEPIKILIIENILKYCSDLITLEIKIDSKTDLLVFPYFRNLEIKVLNINVVYCQLVKALIDLANNLPINVKEVSIAFIRITLCKYYDCTLLFEKFIESCHCHLEIINLNKSIRSDLLKLILNYIKRSNGNLKVLGMAKLRGALKKRESKLLNKIKDNGVKIVNFRINEADDDCTDDESIYEFDCI